MKPIIAAPLLVLLTTLALPAHADRYSVPKNAAFEEECASCHMAYPPQMLHADSWRAMMGDLSRHFGSDASIDEKRRVAIADFLVANSGGRKTGNTRDAQGRPLLRITETARFEKKHREISAATWKRASIKSPANCTACHTQAAAGDYDDRSIKIPK
ncbi:MAG: cytochrome C [Rhodocyclaceae bacterium]|nr:MAG: cytochrome C [Rhodocyclaceae bacterium]TND00734.1 MAG: cytochrome C [Rhodocyclaceae bacterium]